MGPHALLLSERVTAILRAGGVPDRLAVLGQHLLIAAVNGFTFDEIVTLGAGADAAEPEDGPTMVPTSPRSPSTSSPASSRWPTTSPSPTRTSASTC